MQLSTASSSRVRTQCCAAPLWASGNWAIHIAMGVPASPPAAIAVGRARIDDIPLCLEIRRKVFIEEQGVSEAEELDDLDAHCLFWIARISGRAVGTARVRTLAGDAKVERVAVLRESRRCGVGRALMKAIEHWALSRGLDAVALNAQESAIPFYRSLGYAVTSDPFDDAGIPHRAMRKQASTRGA